MSELKQANRVVADIRTFFATTQADPAALRAVLPATIQLLAEGRPASPAEIAAEAALPIASVETALRDLGDVEWTPDGPVEGAALTPRPTLHRIRIGDVDRYAWCAMDTLFFAAIPDRRAEVESPERFHRRAPPVRGRRAAHPCRPALDRRLLVRRPVGRGRTRRRLPVRPLLCLARERRDRGGQVPAGWRPLARGGAGGGAALRGRGLRGDPVTGLTAETGGVGDL